MHLGPFRLPDISEIVWSRGHWQLHTECEFFLRVSEDIVQLHCGLSLWRGILSFTVFYCVLIADKF